MIAKITKKCDRCGKLYELYNTENDSAKINGFVTVNIDWQQDYFSHGPYDLCPSCSKQLMGWFENEKENNYA